MSFDEELRQVVSAVLGVSPESLGESSDTDTIAGWDSLKHVDLLTALESTFGVTIPDEEAANLTSFPLIRLVVSELKGAR